MCNQSFSFSALFYNKKDTASFGRIMTPVFPNNNSLAILAVWDKRSGKATHTNLQILKPFHTCGTFKCQHVKDLLMNEVSYVPHWPLVFFHHKRFDIHSITNKGVVNTRGPCNVNFNQ